MSRSFAALLGIVALGLAAAACGADPQATSQGTVVTAPTNQSQTSGTVTVPPTTEAPTVAAGTTATTPDPASCRTGTVPVLVAVGREAPPVCLVVGATLKVTFDKSRAQIGAPGPWGLPLVQAYPHLLRVRSAHKVGPLLLTTLVAVRPGTASVSAGFGQECTGPQTTPCTIPPQAILTVPVTVVAAPPS